MKKVLISLGIVVIFAGYVIYQHLHSAPAIAPAATPVTQTDQTPVSQNPPAATTTGSADETATATTSPVTKGAFKDGTYTGTVADAVYGQLQVTAVISGGKLTDVQFPVFPNSPGHTTEVSQQALPVLKSEAIAAQSANVQIVSGATQDSQAFQESLKSALSQAM
jgi:uncharacterized protein with FMN-binding domain